MRITRLRTLISLPAMFSQNRLNPIMQRAKNDRSVQRAISVYDNGRTCVRACMSACICVFACNVCMSE